MSRRILVVSMEWEKELLPRLVEAASRLTSTTSVIDLVEIGWSTGEGEEEKEKLGETRHFRVELDKQSLVLEAEPYISRLLNERDYLSLILADTEAALWLSGWLAGRLSLDIITEAVGLSVGDNNNIVIERPAYEESVLQTYVYGGSKPIIINVRTGAFRPTGEAVIEFGNPVLIGRARPEKDMKSIAVVGEKKESTMNLGKTRIVVGAGLGIEDPERLKLVEKLAILLGGEWGVTRPLVDNGWAPRERMIGHSGAKIQPQLYIAMGISGAPYHISGVMGAETIIAINKDPGAPIFKYSDYGIIADLREALPTLIEKLEKARKK